MKVFRDSNAFDRDLEFKLSDEIQLSNNPLIQKVMERIEFSITHQQFLQLNGLLFFLFLSRIKIKKHKS
jgi:hypothetical protein